jgi:hypothetical protein
VGFSTKVWIQLHSGLGNRIVSGAGTPAVAPGSTNRGAISGAGTPAVAPRSIERLDLAALRAEFRLLTGDTAVPALWSDAEVDRLINLALVEACDRGMLIFDRSSFTITTTPAVSEYALNPSILRIKAAWLVGLTVDAVKNDDLLLPEMTDDELTAWARWYRFGADSASSTVSFGTSRYGVTEDRKFIISPTPTEARAINFDVWRLPVVLVADSDVPEIASIYHAKLLSWVLHLGYSKLDSETYNEKLAEKYEADFERDFGPPKNAMQRRAQLENRTLRTRPSPF